MATHDVIIRPAAVGRVCTASIAAVVALHALSQFARFAYGRDYQLGLAQRLYLGAEASVPNWLSTILLGLCAAALYAIAAARRDDRARWQLLAIIFVLLSLDEAAALHDLLSPFFAGVFTRLAETVGGPFVALARKPNYAWQIPVVVLCTALAAAYVPFVFRLPRATRLGVILAGAIYVGGAVGVDFIEGWYSGLHGPKNPVFVAMVTLEETLEMAGAALFLYTLVRYAEAEFGELRIRFA